MKNLKYTKTCLNLVTLNIDSKKIILLYEFALIQKIV